MASETVEQVCEKMDKESGEYHIDDYGLSSYEVGLYKDRILAAHKRELAAKNNERHTVSANYEAVIAAKERIIAAKDAEIEDLKKRIAVYEEVVTENGGRFLKQDAEIAKRNALIKELADALSSFTCYLDCKKLPYCNEDCDKCIHIKNKELISKAREVAK